MASRVAGAVLALTAAALLAVSVVASAWWQGHPHFNGAEIKAKEISVGPLGATGCNTGGDGACMTVPVDATFETAGYALAGVAGLLGLTALLLAVLTASGAARRKSFAVIAIVGAIVATLLAIVLVIVGPQIRTEAPLPFSAGLYIFFGGIGATLGSSVFALRTPAPKRMQLAPARQSLQHMPQPHAHAGVDVHALLAEDALRPSSLGPEPKLGRGSPGPVQSPGGMLPGPSGPLGASGPQPLFSSAPQLRPLYDVAPGQGGTGGFVPTQPAQFQLRAPTPIPRDQISALAGIPTPASIDVQRPVTMAGTAPPPVNLETDRDLLGARRAKPQTLPPPNRNRPVSVAPIPPLVPPAPKTLATAAVPPPPNTTLAASPPPPQLETDDEPFDAMKTYQREPAPKPAPPKPVVPLPAKPAQKPRAPTPRPPTRLLTEDAALDTDVSTSAIGAGEPERAGYVIGAGEPERAGYVIDDDQPATETFETATEEATNFRAPPRPPTASATMQTAPAPPDTASTDMELPTVRPPTETSPSTRPPTETSPSTRPPTETSQSARPPTETSLSAQPAPEPEPEPAPAPAPAKLERPEDPPKLPISTAPDSLPPPTEKQAAASGPSPACPQCEAPMAWVEAHLRFYCKSCKMYF